MLRLWWHLCGDRGGSLRKDGIRQAGFHAEGVARLHCLLGHVLPDAPSRLCAQAEAGYSLLSPRRSTEWSVSMNRPVDQAENAEKFLADIVHEERLDKLL